MKNSVIDAILINSRPSDYKLNVDFTRKVMGRINDSPTLTTQFDNKKQNKKNPLKKGFARLPRFALILIAIGVLLALSGTTYALYKTLWEQPQVHLTSTTTTSSGRKAVVLALTQCSNNNHDVASHYELKKDATITIAEVPQVVQAHCELDAIQNWAITTFPNNWSDESIRMSTTAHDETQIMVSMATHIKSASDGSITFAGLPTYGQSDATFAVGSNVRYIADGQDVKASAISTSDPVVYIMSNVTHETPSAGCTATSCSMSGSQVSSTLVAVVKLDLPFQYYDQFAWQSLTEIDTCMGNPNDSCLTGYAGSIDLFGPGNTNASAKGITKEIQGVITAINGATVTIQSTSGSIFTITAPSDVISAYNTNKAAQYYNSQYVAVGKSLDVLYLEPADQQNKTINPSQLVGISFMLEILSKGSPVTAY